MSAVIIPFKPSPHAAAVPRHVPELIRRALEETGIPTSITELQRMAQLTGAQVLAGLCKLDDWGDLVKCRGARYALRTPEGAA